MSTRQIVFPARAGMSRLLVVSWLYLTGVPRASGDEPSSSRSTTTAIPCSPRERG